MAEWARSGCFQPRNAHISDPRSRKLYTALQDPSSVSSQSKERLQALPPLTMSTSDVVTATVPTITYSSSTSYEIERLTNFGPLTTTYTAPEICQSDPANLGIVAFTITGSNYTTTSYDCRQVENRYIQNPACYPSSSAVQEFQAAALSELYGAYYSPGVICPSAWTTAATGIYPPADTYSSIPAWVDPMIGNRDMSATFVYCCPT